MGNNHQGKNTRVSTDIIDRKWIDVNIPCKAACPIMTDIPGYIQAIMEGDFQKAYEINRRDNVLPGVLGRVCNRPCEPVCRHGRDGLGDSVAICHLKRCAADFGLKPLKPEIESRGKKVCIIGAGPAGLTAANDLALKGYDVTILEQFHQPGGMLRYGIPQFRLPYDIVAADVESITGLGVKIKTGTRVDNDSGLEKLKKEYDAVLLAGGCMLPKRINIPGIDSKGVYWGLDFMIASNSEAGAGPQPMKEGEGSATPAGKMSKNERLSPGTGMKKVVVIGGGFTAVDCTRMALRLNAKEVTLAYRRTKDDMYVSAHELVAIEAEGIHLNFLVSPIGVETEAGSVSGIKFIRSRINRDRSIEPIAGSEFLMEADVLILAIGQQAEGEIAAGKKNKTADIFFTAGDFRNGASTVIEAAADGRKAAADIHKFLSGLAGYEDKIEITTVDETGRKRDYDFIPLQPMDEIPLHERRIKDKEVETGFSKEKSLIESRRCYLCHYNFQIDIDRCIYCLACIDVMPVDCIKMAKDVQVDEDGNMHYIATDRWDEVQAITIDNDKCIRCGNCVRACPVDCISISKYKLEVIEHK
ncbi:MAG: FAD-dependent oxidoreductase [Candidatus Aminicenantes bacterium]|nr:FAD-dependent oxidoreductase [Candidatus Aminicenantes bacterium]